MKYEYNGVKIDTQEIKKMKDKEIVDFLESLAHYAYELGYTYGCHETCVIPMKERK